MTARTLHLDYETASTVNLKAAGMHVYAAHPSTRILMLGWAFDDEPVQLWQPHLCAIPPARLVEGLVDPNVICEAANAPFERLITYHRMGIAVAYERWRCVLIKAYYLGFAGRLDDVLSQTGLQQKDLRGGRLINKFCKPAPPKHKVDWYTPKNSPEDWAEFCEYCVKDVIVERALSTYLARYPAMPAWDWAQWSVDQRVNDRGVPLDTVFAGKAIEIWYGERDRLADNLAQQTGLPKPTRGPFLAHINGLVPAGEEFESLAKDYVTSRRTKGDLTPHVLGLLDLWQGKEAKAATKYAAVLKCVNEDDRARGMFQYKAASRTDRAGGRRLQLQNLKRPVVKDPSDIPVFVETLKQGDAVTLRDKWGVTVSEALGGAIRHVIRARPGKTLVVADLSSIESVVLGWLTGCELINTTFKSGRDSYRVFGAEYYGIDYDEVTKGQRTFCKPPVLGCGYMLGWKGLIRYAEGMGVAMGEGDARKAVDTFRGMYPEIPTFWRWLDKALKFVTESGLALTGYRLRIERDADFLRILLPSGRNLSYYRPQMVISPAPWDPNKTVENFAYMGMNDKRQWVLDTAHAGGVTENIIQSIAGDILWGGITNAHAEGLPVVLHVHDEIGAEVDEHLAGPALATLEQCMTRRPLWAQDMWLGADGFTTNYYTKD